MVGWTKGVIVTCNDESVKEFILHLNRTHDFVIADLDDTHLFCTKESPEIIKTALDILHDRISFSATEMKG